MNDVHKTSFLVSRGRLPATIHTASRIASARSRTLSYDPATATWSKVTQAPSEGNVLAGTSTGADSTTVLRLMSTTGQAVLYRYVI